MNNRPYLLFLIVLVPLVLFPLALPSSFSIDTSLAPIFETIPLKVGHWQGKDVEIDERTYQILETRNVLSRLYSSSQGETVHLLVVASQKDRRVAHPPEVCYVSSNYTVLNEREETLQVGQAKIPVKEFIAQDKKNPAHSEKVIYVYKIGERFTTNYFSQQLQFAWDRLTRRESQVLLIRLAGREQSSFAQFLAEILPHLS